MKCNSPILLTALFFVIFSQLGAQHLIDSEFLSSRTKEELLSDYGFIMQNGAELHKIVYTTLDVHGVPDTASGLLAIPLREAESIYPMACYQHGTVGSRWDVPSNLSGGYELGEGLAGLGYITVAPDYLGLGESRGVHPYVHAASEASAAIDLLYAAREFADQNEVFYSNDLFLTGYSQGGHASMALHREIEKNYTADFEVKAASHMSGPYSISGVMKEALVGDAEYSTPSYIPNVLLSYDLVYGLFDNTEEYFKDPYAEYIDLYKNEQITLWSLNNFLEVRLNENEGAVIPSRMFQDSIIEAVLTNPEHPFNLALEDNDVYDWAPRAPTRLLYCGADEQVFFANSLLADSVMNANGATDVEAINLNPDFDHGECIDPAVSTTAFFFAQYQSIFVDTEEVARDHSINFFPNPVSDELFINGFKEEAMVCLIDINGRFVLKKDLEPGDPVDISSLAEGIYLLQVKTRDTSYFSKVVVRH